MQARFIAASALVILFSACATTGGYEKVLESWVGKDINSVIEAWGQPADTYTLTDGSILYTWFTHTHRGTVAVPFRKKGLAVRRSCMTTFTVGTDGVIKSWKHEGNACKA